MSDRRERRLRARPSMTALRRTGAAVVGALTLALPIAAAASDVETTQTQLQTICEALKKSSGQSCGARARAAHAAPTPMSSEASSAAPLDQPVDPPLVRPVDAWGRAIRISVDSGTINLESAGPDGEFGDGDDIARRCPPAP